MRPFFLAAILAAAPTLAHGHDKWSNGEPVPAWVKSLCCGPEDVHHIPASAITIKADGYHVEGLDVAIPFARALPSPDGQYWGFWRDSLEPTPVIFCFFVPVNGA